MFRQIVSLSVASALALTLSVNSWAAQTWTVNFKDSDIQEVIKFVADVTGRTVIIDPRVKGKVKVISAKPLTEPELLQLFRTVLEIHDFSMVEVEDLIRIIPLKDTRSAPVPVTDGKGSEKGFLTQVIQLQNIAAAKVLPSIRPLVPQHSHLSAYDPSNAIIITDSAENIARIRSLIELLDQSASPVTEIYELKFANAVDLVQVLDSLEKADRKTNSPQNSVNLTADKRNNAILITGEDLQRVRIRELISRLDKPRAQTGNVRVVYLDYADAKVVSETLTKVMANLSKLGPGGKVENAVAATVEADEDTNALLITASGDDLQTLLDVVTRLDIRRAQVLVEAIIVEVGDEGDRNLGIEWMYRNSKNGVMGSSNNGGALGGFATATAAASTDPDGPDGALALEAAGKALLGGLGQVLGVVADDDGETFLGVLNALEQDSKTNILSTPSILTMDNHEATFTVGENIPILTGSTSATNGSFSPFQTIQREDVGIKLTVTPQVNEGNRVLLDISQEVSDVLPDPGPDGFRTSKRQIETQVLAASGEIIVLGGLIQDKNKKSEQRVPLLGRIPVIGRLFRNEGKTTQKSNLMVFLRASVIRSDEAMAGATAEKYRYIRDQQLQMRDNGFMRLKSNDLPILPTLEEYQAKPAPGVIMTPGAKKAANTAESEE